MASKAFVLIETTVGKTKEVVTSLRKLEGVKSVDPVTGPYDVIVIIEGESLTDISDQVTVKVHRVPGISRTVTCLTID